MADNKISPIIREWMDVFMQRSMHGWMHYVKSTGLSMPQFNILMHIHYKGACGLSEISDRFDISAAAASQLVDKLVNAGYLERTEDLHDRRAKQLTLSISGASLIKDGIEKRYLWMDHLAENLSEYDQQTVSQTLTMLINAATKMDQ